MDAPAARPMPERALAAAAVAVAAAAAYADSFQGSFLYDDTGSIVDNPTLRSLGRAFSPPAGGLPVSGRPLANASLALNYAWSGLHVWSYHLLSLLIHIAAGLLLLGIVRRTLKSLPIAFGAALLWTLHPLQTESVTYLSQRAESLMGLFYLLTLYGFVRGSRPWLAASVAACFLGMASKEVMVTAPILVLLYDRTFVAGGLGEAWRRRKGYYLALFSSWLLLAGLVAANGGRGGTAGYGSTVTWQAYAFTQIRAVVRYLGLSLWPRSLTFDYGLTLGGPVGGMLWDAAVLAALLVATGYALKRHWPAGFLGAWYFLILAPSSSVVPVATELIAEHRAYLPLAAVVVGVVVLVATIGRRIMERLGFGPGAAMAVGLAATLGVGAVLGVATAERNHVYRSVLDLWADVVAKEPDSAGARNNYGNALAEQGRLTEAIEQYRAALRLAPDYDDPHYNLGNALAKREQWAEAAEHYRAALRFRDGEAQIHYALGAALWHLGRTAEAEAEYERALGSRTDSAVVWYNLGNGFLDTNRMDLAAEAFGRAIALRPDYPDALVNYGAALAQLGRGDDAVRAFEQAVRLEPKAPDIRNGLGGVLAEMGRYAEARVQFEEALRLKPDFVEAERNLERVQALSGKAQGP